MYRLKNIYETYFIIFMQTFNFTVFCKMGWMTGVQFPAGAMLGCFLFAITSRPVLRLTQPPIQWVPRPLTPVIKRPGCDVDHSPPSGAEVKNAWSYTSTPQYFFMVWCLVKHRNNFTFTF